MVALVICRFCVQESGSNLAGQFCLEISPEFEVRCQLQSVEGLTGAGGSIFKVTHLNVSGDWQEPSVALHLDPSKRLPECSYSMVAGFPRVRDLRDQGGSVIKQNLTE